MGAGQDIAWTAAAVVTSPLWTYRLLRTGKWQTDWPARFGQCNSVGPADDRPTLLLHAVSVGEVGAIRLLVDQLERRTDWRIVISVTTDTGTTRARSLFSGHHAVVRYPLDFSPAVHRFLDAVRPNLVGLVELELWPNFIEACRRRRIGVCVLNGRLSVRSFRRYSLVRPIVRPTFARLDAVAVQDQAYRQRFIELGVDPRRVCVLDTMKWDAAQITDRVEGAEELAVAMGLDRSRPLIVAGSTAPGEDELLIRTCPDHAQLMLVPRKPEWFDAAAAAAGNAPIIRRSHHPDGSRRTADGQRLFLLDTIGELRKAYALADVVIVGRSFLGLYGSDMIEPIGLGKPTIIGPYHGDFAQMVRALQAGGGLEVSDSPGPLAATLLADPQRATALADRGRRVIRTCQGSTGRHAELLASLMPGAARRQGASLR